MKRADILIALEAERGRRSFYDFVRLAWPVLEPGITFMPNWHMQVICEHLEKVTRGEIPKLIINVAPASGKSSLVCVLWNVWDWIQDPTKRFLYTSFDSRLTHRDGGRALALISSSWFQRRWPHVRVRRGMNAAVGDFVTTANGARFATSVNGKSTGEHPNRVVVDDPIKPKECTKSALENVHDWWRGTMFSRGNPLDVARVIIMQRVHEDDLCGWILRNEPGEWVVVSIPAEYESARAQPWDPRTTEGESFWPARLSEALLAKYKGAGGLGHYHYQSQYQQDPAPADGTIFLNDWFKNRWTQLPAQWDDSCQSWDMTFKDSDGSDYVVGQVWVRSGASYYLVDQFRQRCSFTAACQAVKDMSNKWPKVRTKLIEDKANGTAIIDTLKKSISGMVPINPEGGKRSRANAVTSFFQAGNVFLPNTPWIMAYIDELCRFPGGTHDDQVDATTQAINYLHLKTTSYKEMMKNAASIFGSFR